MARQFNKDYVVRNQFGSLFDTKFHPLDGPWQTTDATVAGYVAEGLPVLPPLGSQAIFRGGDSYRFVKTAVAVTRGQTVASCGGLMYATGFTAVAAGARGFAATVTAPGADIAANRCESAIVVKGTGIGYKFFIKSHAAVLASGTALTGTVDGELEAAIATTDDAWFLANRWDVKLTPAAVMGVLNNGIGPMPIGVCVNPFPALAGTVTQYYGWVQTGGVAAVLYTGTTTNKILPVCASTTAGSVDAAVQGAVVSYGVVPICGHLLGLVTTSTDFAAVQLALEIGVPYG
jgi:hypothetical protein